MPGPLTILCGDVLEKLGELPDASAHCVVTSPPYWNLRDYKVDGQIGLEKTPQDYLAKLVAVFREVRRVLRPDGTLWMNMGDCYNNSGRTGGKASIPGTFSFRGKAGGAPVNFPGLKAKELTGMPWRLALALQEDGWYLRCDNIWAKTNPMPESVTDRPTKSHEYLFLFSKRAKYFYDAEAIREPATGTAHARGHGVNPGKNSRIHVDRDPAHLTKIKRPRANESFSAAVTGLVSTKNKRSVWHLATHSFRGAHFATFPPALVTPCILAGTSEKGCCGLCGSPFKRIVHLGEPDREHQIACGSDQNGDYTGQGTKDFARAKAQDASATKARILAGMRHRITTGWKQTCKCELITDPKPCVVLDPFAGSGTTGEVALKLGRHAILIELNPEYIPLIERRCAISTPQAA